MAKGASKQPTIGDVVEVQTPKGLAYAQYSHFHDKPPKFGYLLRVLPGVFDSRPRAFAALVDNEAQFNIFFPLAAALRRGEVEIVGREPVPERCRSFPLFRGGNPHKDGHIDTWWLWDGDREWKVGALTEELTKVSIHRICDTTALIEYIVQGYSPLDEV